MKILLSHASADRAQAEAIRLALVAAGHVAFFDEASLLPERDARERTRAAVARSDAMVFLISPESVQLRSRALGELRHARGRWPHARDRVVPVMLRPTAWDLVPRYLATVAVLEPEGDVAADVVAAIGALAGSQRGDGDPPDLESRERDGADGAPSVALRAWIFVLVAVAGIELAMSWDRCVPTERASTPPIASHPVSGLPSPE